ncbi:MAG TPA: hypothetical protein DDW89_07270, partial [Gammaproteobacteria bacterium]|nr:hypothetical protein [Gammaproteobacteria bacterium]
PAALAGLSLAIGAALAQLLTGLGVEQVSLKWPNDVLCGGGKLGGILIELQGDTQGPCWAVAGLGLNVNMLIADGGGIEQAWNSLARASGRAWDRTGLAAQVVEALLRVMHTFPETGLEPWLPSYARFDGLAGRTVHVDWAGERVGGLWFIFVDAHGQPIPGKPNEPETGNAAANQIIMEWEQSR